MPLFYYFRIESHQPEFGYIDMDTISDNLCTRDIYAEVAYTAALLNLSKHYDWELVSYF